MIVEVVALLAVLTGGTALCRAVGVSGWPLPAVGFVTGTALTVLIGTLQVVTGAPTTPVLTLALTVAVPVAVLAVVWRRGRDVSMPVPALVVGGLTVIVITLLARGAGLVSVTPDSFRYATVATLLATGQLDQALPFTLQTRLLAVPVIHAPAHLTGESYLAGATPVLAIATAGTLAWLCRDGLRQAWLPASLVTTGTLLGVALLVTNNRFLFHATYLNGHLLFAALVLVAAGTAWLSARALPERTPGATLLMTLALATLVVVRPEGVLVAAFVLFPVLFDGRQSRSARLLPAAGLGASTAGWHAFVVADHLADGQDAPLSAVALLVAGVVLLLLAVAGSRLLGVLSRARTTLLAAVEIALWLALAVAVVAERGVFTASVDATIRNVVLDEGGWGVSLVMLGLLVVAVLALTATGERVCLRFPLTTFVPLSALLAYLREGAYRVGPGDSLNRMLLHMVPLAILLVVAGLESARWGRPPRHAPETSGAGQ